jgi:hypothetical protein
MKHLLETLENRTLFTTVGIATLNPNASEAGPTPATFIVYRSDRLSVPTRVYFSVGGTATSPLVFPGTNADYTGITAPPPVATMAVASLTHAPEPGISPITGIIGGGNTAFCDIPANDTYTTVTITPIDDTRVEGPETAIFTLKSSTNYDIGTPSSVTITIHDNDGPVFAADLNDTYVRDGASANTNFGHDAHLQVKKGPTGFNRGALIQFDLTHIDPLAGFQHVTLKLWGALNNTNQKNVATGVFGYSDPTWDESAVTWNHRPIVLSRGPVTPLATTNIIDNQARWYTFDVTSFVQSELAAGHTTCTLALANLNVSDPYVWFNSRQAGSNKPELVFT